MPICSLVRPGRSGVLPSMLFQSGDCMFAIRYHRVRFFRELSVSRQVLRPGDAEMRESIRRRFVYESAFVLRVFRALDEAAQEKRAHALRGINPAYPINLTPGRSASIQDHRHSLESGFPQVSRELPFAE